MIARLAHARSLAGVILLLSLVGGVARAQTCPDGNLLAGTSVSGTGVRGDPGLVVDGRIITEGAAWDAPGAAVLPSSRSSLVVDLQQPLSIRALLIQADNNDSYVVEGSADGAVWTELWRAPAVQGSGLRTRVHDLAEGRLVRQLRVRGSQGDKIYSVSELQAWCQVPARWPVSSLASVAPPPPEGWLDQAGIDAIKTGVAALGTVLFLWGIALRRAGRPEVDAKVRDRSLLALGLFAGLCWWNLLYFHFDRYEHVWEHYHYFMGSKYVRELGYSRLYECTVVADLEAGLRDPVLARRIRNLETNRIETTASVVADPERCKDHFTSGRWDAFTRDIAFFRGQMTPGRWADAQRDHGYNGTPAWGIAGTLLTNLAPASATTMRMLALLDPLLLVVMWGFVHWAFGWRAMCVAMLWWGTNYPARFWWVGGSLLRQDWLAATIIGICLVKRGRMASGGAALTYASLLRIFPGFVVLGLVLKVGAGLWRKRSLELEPAHRRFALGCIAALVAGGLLSTAVAGQAGIWGDFVRNSRTHLSTPLTNNVGLQTLLSYQHSTRAEQTHRPEMEDPFSEWKEARRQVFEGRRLLFVAVLGAFVLLLGRVAERQEDWAALVLGIGLIPFATELTCYYYSVLLGFGLLWELKRERIAALLCGLSLVTYLCSYGSDWYDEVFALISLATLVFVVWATLWIGRAEGDGPGRDSA